MQLITQRKPVTGERPLRVTPLDTADRCEVPRNKPSAERICCPGCDKTFSGAAVANDAPFQDDALKWMRIRQLYCDHCRHIIMWHELCTPEGKLLGLVDSGPVIVTSKRAIEFFLKRFPWAAGITQT